MMRLFSTLAILTLVSACAESSASTNALCQGTKQSQKAHGESLLIDGGPKSVATGATLLGQLKVGCNGG